MARKAVSGPANLFVRDRRTAFLGRKGGRGREDAILYNCTVRFVTFASKTGNSRTVQRFR